MNRVIKCAPRRNMSPPRPRRPVEQGLVCTQFLQTTTSPLRSGGRAHRPRPRETTVLDHAESRKPRAKGQKTSSSMKSESCARVARVDYETWAPPFPPLTSRTELRRLSSWTLLFSVRLTLIASGYAVLVWSASTLQRNGFKRRPLVA